MGVSLKELLGDKKSIGSPFGKGPWPCLNPAVPHYQKDIITECKINRREGTVRPVGVFRCKCGFVYSRVGPDTNESDKYKLEYISSYGSAWEENLIRLAINERVPKLEISRELKVSVQTINSCLRRLLNNERRNRISILQEKMDVKMEHERSEWLSVVNNNPGMKRTDLRRITRNTFYWLNKYDNAWLISHCPRPTPNTSPGIKTDWDKRDQDLVQKIFMAARQIKDTKGKPIKISIESVSRELGINNALHRSAINRMPLTQKALKEITEELPEFYLRKVRWGIKTLKENGASLTKWKVFEIAGGKRELILQIIEEELERISLG